MKRFKAHLLFAAYFSLTSISAQTYSSIIPDKEIYSFMNWVSANDSLGVPTIYYQIDPWDSLSFFEDSSHRLDFYLFGKWGQNLDTILNEADRKFILKQFRATKDSIWENKFKCCEMTRDLSDSYFYSIPLFSLDRKYVILHTGFSSSVGLGSFLSYRVYRKTGRKKWEFVADICEWVS